MPKPNRQQRRAVSSPSPVQAVVGAGTPKQVAITDAADRKRLLDLNTAVTEAMVNLGKQQRLVCLGQCRRDQLAIGGSDGELGDAQCQLMEIEQRRNDFVQAVGAVVRLRQSGMNEISLKYGIPVGEPGAPNYTIDLDAFVITPRLSERRDVGVRTEQ